MKRDKPQSDAIPPAVSRDEFTRIMGNLASSPPERRKDIRAGGKKEHGRKMIPPKPQTDSDQQ